MSRDPRFTVLNDDPQQGPPIEGERVIAAPVIGVVAGLVIGVALDLVFAWFGGRSSPLSVAAMPIAAAVIGLTMGMLLSAAGRSRLDATVRDRPAVRSRRPSTTEHFHAAQRR
jgi:hypothetical protein